MAIGDLIPRWSFGRNLPSPFEDYTDNNIRTDVYSKYCIQPNKRSTLHASTLRAILAYMELESPDGTKSPEELGALGSQGNNFTIAEYPSKTGKLHVIVYNQINGKSCCTRQRRNTLTRLVLQSCLPSNLCGRNTPDFWNRSKRKAYSAYKQARADMKELYNVRANVEYLLDIPTGRGPERNTQKSRQ